MSRRYAIGAVRNIRTVKAIEESQRWEDVPETRHEPLVDWQEAWAETTINVVERVWSTTGARMYFAQRDKLLREDLRDWLVVQAQLVANAYTPNWDAQDPMRYWAAHLRKTLLGQARWHFEEVLGGADSVAGKAAREAHARGVVSTDYLDEQEKETGSRVKRHVLHSDDFLAKDPAVVVLWFDSLPAMLREIDALRASRPGGYQTTSEGCIEAGCNAPAMSTGRCTKHEREYRRAWGREDGRPACAIPGCELVAERRSLCVTHAAHLQKGTLPVEFIQYVTPGRIKNTECTVCGAPVYDRGKCRAHLFPPCSVEGCSEEGSFAGGLCQTRIRE